MSKSEAEATKNRFRDGFIMERPRVKALLSKALEKPVTLVHAGPGCGKSCAVASHLLSIEACIMWVQLSDADNSPPRFWENICNTLMRNNSAFASVLAAMGFPGVGERYKLCYDKIADMLRPNERYILVFDDIHMINNSEVRAFLLALAEMPLPYTSNVFISREESISIYDVGTSDEDLASIDEQDMLFTKAEVADYLSMLETDFPPTLIDEVYAASEGLAHLVNLAAKLIRRRPASMNQISNIIKLNVSKLIDEAFFEESSVEMKKFLVKLSLLDHLPHDLVYSLPGGRELITDVLKVTTMIRNDTYMHAYHLHNLFIEFLKDKEGMLTDGEKSETYRKAAEWCAENNYKIEAIGYYEKTGDYAAIVKLANYRLLDMDFHTASYLLGVFENADARVFDENPFVRVLYARVLLSLGKVDEAIDRINGFIAEMESRKITKADAAVLIWLYNNLGFAKIIKVPDTGECNFSELFKKAAGYMDMAGMDEAPEVVNSSILPYACVVSSSKRGEPEKLIEEISKSIPYTMRTLGGCLCGSDDLTRSEVAYYRGDMAACERYAIQCCLNARESGQSYIAGRALFLMLRMNLCRGRFDKIGEVLDQYDELVKRSNHYLEYVQQDIVLSWYYASIGETENVAPWVKNDFPSIESEAYITGLEDMTKLKYYFTEKKYHVLLAFLDRRPTNYGIRKYLIGRIAMEVCEAICLYNLKDRKGAMKALKRAYELSAPNSFDMSFIEMGNNMRSLAGAALREGDCGIPAAWLELIRSKSATYAKRIAHVKSRYRHDVGKEGEVLLTLKEHEVLQDMSQGLSRTEIAAYRGISVNTVKAMLQIVYEKLGADNSMDALRIAISKNLI